MPLTFVVDCHACKAKVAATQKGEADYRYSDEGGFPSGVRLFIGNCPRCESVLVGEATQIEFEGETAGDDEWADVVRVYPNPPRVFTSLRIPKVVTESLLEANRCIQANATIAACVMLGRALEALCRDVLKADAGPPSDEADTGKVRRKKFVMLAEGIRQIHQKGIIDSRLYEWSQQLHAFRNLAAHPDEISITREDVEDLQTFASAIVEYIYDLSDKYEEFKERQGKRSKRNKKK